ncbi:hypothetical protein QYM36_016259 [Artemia franciscana]|uniref:Uncharacterized protein n=1 Tax=Artemia franciscana TaxID=6661 RepID=A0AA88H7B2_ARTSF|nr:hypothetical protein QYM36_016259 [Artemia franciscana]
MSNRIMIAHMHEKHAKMTLVVCYVPANEATDNQKETLYNELTSVLKDVPGMTFYKAENAKETARQGDSQSVSHITNEIVGKYNKTDGLVKDESGLLLTDPDKFKEAWAIHFRKLLKRPLPADPPSIPN